MCTRHKREGEVPEPGSLTHPFGRDIPWVAPVKNSFEDIVAVRAFNDTVEFDDCPNNEDEEQRHDDDRPQHLNPAFAAELGRGFITHPRLTRATSRASYQKQSNFLGSRAVDCVTKHKTQPPRTMRRSPRSPASDCKVITDTTRNQEIKRLCKQQGIRSIPYLPQTCLNVSQSAFIRNSCLSSCRLLSRIETLVAAAAWDSCASLRMT